MGYPPLENLLPRASHSVYKLVRMASKRALELADGQPSLIEKISSEKTATIALEEIFNAKVMLRAVAVSQAKTNKKSKSEDKADSKEKEEQVEGAQV